MSGLLREVAGCGRPAVKDRLEIDFQIGLKAALLRRQRTRDQPPAFAIRQDAPFQTTAVEIPFDLFRRVFALVAELVGAIPAQSQDLASATTAAVVQNPAAVRPAARAASRPASSRKRA